MLRKSGNDRVELGGHAQKGWWSLGLSVYDESVRIIFQVPP